MSGRNDFPDKEALGEKAQIAHEEAAQLAPLSEEEKRIEKKLRVRIDSLILPLIICIYLMNYIDRNNYAAAKLQGLMGDLNLNEQEYQTGLSILFVGYILMQVPSNLLLNYISKPSWYLGFFTCAWGLISALTCQVTNYGGIVACRFLLGLVEAPFFAGVLFYLSKWYTKKELAFRMSIFYSGSLLSGAFGNLIAAGILNGLAGARGYSPWQWLYIIEGAITCVLGLLVCLVLPDYPETASKLLTPEMKDVAIRRLAIEATEADVDELSQMQALKLAFTDIKTYVLALGYMCITGAAGFQNYFPTLVKKALGFNEIISLVLVAPPYLFVMVWSLVHSWVSDKFEKRFWFFIYPIPLTFLGFILFMTTESFGSQYAALCLMSLVWLQFGVFFSWISSAIPRPPAKRAAAYAFINAVGNSASIWTPYTYRKEDVPHYRPAMGVNIALQFIGLLCAIFLYFNMRHLNKQAERFENEDVQFTDLTEKEMRRLQHTADLEGVDIDTARQLHRGIRYIL